MSGSVSGSQFGAWTPRAVPKIARGNEESEPVTGSMYQEWSGLPESTTLDPHAAGANTSFDRVTAYRSQGGPPLPHSDRNLGSWLIKNA